MRFRGRGSQWRRRRNWNATAHCASGSLASSALWTARAEWKWWKKKRSPRKSPLAEKKNNFMPREIVTIECTEARKEGRAPSRYMTTRNKKTKTEKVELKKYNPALRRHTLHREIK